MVVGFGESFSAPEVVWSLTRAGFRVASFVRKGSRAALRASRCTHAFDLTPPELDALATVRDLKAHAGLLASGKDPRLIFLPLDDAAVWLCTQIDQKGGSVVVGPGVPRVDFALDKHRQVEFAKHCGFRVPRTILTKGGVDIDPSALQFPVVVKGAQAVSLDNGRLGRERLFRCATARELSSALVRCTPNAPMLIQEFVEGTGEGVFGLATDRGVLAWSAHRRIRMMNPAGSGASACTSIRPSLEDITACKNLISRCEWRGPFMVELLRDSAGRSWFVEFNGRVWGSTALARRCGLEYPAWAVFDALGEGDAVPRDHAPPVGVVCRHAGREAAHALFVLRGPRTCHVAGWPSLWSTLRNLMTFRKSEHWYNWKREEWRVFLKDFQVTLSDILLKRRQVPRT